MITTINEFKKYLESRQVEKPKLGGSGNISLDHSVMKKLAVLKKL